ncbi:crossover junction endodeoxyribonuclease RuvC [Micrococcus lylae]|uniref:crossover junction endodeoxyribonuclease RuvC n=1 Tax=Micrococcus lylae TaxID=1273 RepID=UPI0021A3B96B|nr:crossover junction endodeoxyribonuclease RuvC [Micrococcus lylae]MCT2006470.1 crossover junction endodeoxyribonuclease RuvC [Micrococcus lylae]MCT2070989.1 crossover junction endodeoxyribonuclease RuvC [Micrococcus lylae]
MRVLGVDPGLTRCGIAVVEVDARRRGRLVHVRVSGTPSDAPLHERLLHLDREVTEVLERYAPQRAAVERMFANNNTPTVLGTAQAAGVAITAAARCGLEVGLHTPSEVKAAVTGHGNAGKEQVTAMVTRILGLDAPPRPADAADAIALALAHAWRGTALGRASGQTGLATGSMTSRGGRSRFAEAADSAGRRTVGAGTSLTRAQEQWLAAERSGAATGAARRR